MPDNDNKLPALLNDLRELRSYLHGRGEKTHALSLKFAENAKKDSANREFDLNQSRMLDYQHHIWHEIRIQKKISPILLPEHQRVTSLTQIY